MPLIVLGCEIMKFKAALTCLFWAATSLYKNTQGLQKVQGECIL